MPKIYKHNALLILAITPLLFACTKSKFSAVQGGPPPPVSYTGQQGYVDPNYPVSNPGYPTNNNCLNGGCDVGVYVPPQPPQPQPCNGGAGCDVVVEIPGGGPRPIDPVIVNPTPVVVDPVIVGVNPRPLPVPAHQPRPIDPVIVDQPKNLNQGHQYDVVNVQTPAPQVQRPPRPVAVAPVKRPVDIITEPCQETHYDHSKYIPQAKETAEVNLWIVGDGSNSFPESGDKVAAVRAFIRGYMRSLGRQVKMTIGVISGHSRLSHDSVAYENRSTNWFYKVNPSEPALVRFSPGMSEEKRSAQEQLLISKLVNMRVDNSPGISDGGELLVYNFHAALREDRLAWAKSIGAFSDHAAFGVLFMTDENDICTVDPSMKLKQSEAIAKRDHCFGQENSTIVSKLRDMSKFKPVFTGAYIYTGETAIPRDGNKGIGYGITDILKATGGEAIDLGMVASGHISHSQAAQKIAQLTNSRANMDEARYQILSPAVNNVPGKPISMNQIDRSRTHVFIDGREVQYKVEGDYLHFDGCTAQSQIVIKYCRK